MAKYRQLHTEFWNDGFVLDLTPEEKYFYLYLMTNPHTAQCGIYELPKRIIETHTGYNRETVDKLINRFIDYKKIYYCNNTKEIMIKNWIKFNQPSNINTIKCVNKELKNIKNKKYVHMAYNQFKKLNLNVSEIFNVNYNSIIGNKEFKEDVNLRNYFNSTLNNKFNRNIDEIKYNLIYNDIDINGEECIVDLSLNTNIIYTKNSQRITDSYDENHIILLKKK